MSALNLAVVSLYIAGNRQGGLEGYSQFIPISEEAAKGAGIPAISLQALEQATRESECAAIKWGEAVRRQRDKCPLLTYFTVNQMMQLYRDSQMGSTDVVLRALQFIQPNATERTAQSFVDEMMQDACAELGVSSVPQQLQRTHSLMTTHLIKEGAWKEGVDHMQKLGMILTRTLGNAPQRVRPLRPLEGTPELEKDEALLAQGRGNVVFGVPNSVQAASVDDVLSTVITLYAQETRVPEASEVLLCDKGTTIEEVEIILLRCAAYKEDPLRLYSIVRPNPNPNSNPN